MRRIIDARGGIATRIWEVSADPLTPDIFVTAVNGPPASYLIDGKEVAWSNSSVGSGAGFSREQALWATLGETMERYCASIYYRDRWVFYSEEELCGNKMNTSACIEFGQSAYNEVGFPYVPYDRNIKRNWIKGQSIVDNSQIYVPAQMIYLSQNWSKEEMLVQTVSTGLACHNSSEKASFAGLLELIERDGFASAWLIGYAPPQLIIDAADWARLSPGCQRALSNNNLPITLCSVPNEFGVANVFAFAENAELGYGVVGASARPSVVDAIEKAVIEALHGWSVTTRLRQGAEDIPSLDSIRLPRDHSAYYLKQDTWESLGWFRRSTTIVNSRLVGTDEPISLACLAGRMAANGYPPIAVDVTTSDIAALGFSVIRCLAPGLQPLTFGVQLVPQDRRRLTQLAKQWNVSMPEHLNVAPHPFP